MELNLSFLNKKQVKSETKLKSNISDFAILLGGISYKDDKSNKILGHYWTNNYDVLDGVYFINEEGKVKYCDKRRRVIGIRPVLNINCSSCENILLGEYPQTVVNSELSTILENQYLNNSLIKTGKKYTTDKVHYMKINESYLKETYEEYIFNGNKYIRFVSDDRGYTNILSSGEFIKYNTPYWIKVEPVLWLVRDDYIISKTILVSGIQFNDNRKYNSNFDTTFIKKYMDNYLFNEMFSCVMENKDSKEELNNNSLCMKLRRK